MTDKENIVSDPGHKAAGGQPGQPAAGPRGGQAPAGQGAKPGQPGASGGAKPAPKGPPVVNIRPLAEPARMKRRHWGLLAGFVLFVVIPLAATIWYLWAVSEDQYASTTGFTVRQEEAADASDILGGLAQFAGGSTGSDTDILYEFIQSQELVKAIDARLDLVGHYSAHWDSDPLFSLWPSADAEDLLWFWRRVVHISYDQSSGLVELRVVAFDPDYAQSVAQAIVAESQKMINALNAQAREDAMRYARADLDDAVERLKKAREALTAFRTRTQIVDPESDLQGRMGVLNNLQQQLAEALIEYDLLVGSTNPSDPRLAQAQKRIQVIRERIAAERENFASDNVELGQVGEDYPTLIAEYESLTVDREFAEETYRAALAAVDVARANASRQSRYLATYVRPTLPESSEFPQRFVLAGLAALFLFLAWAILALIYYSIRDRR
ncbi:MAG: sugar transporter [Paracoccaceae bacterium]